MEDRFAVTWFYLENMSKFDVSLYFLLYHQPGKDFYYDMNICATLDSLGLRERPSGILVSGLFDLLWESLLIKMKRL